MVGEAAGRGRVAFEQWCSLLPGLALRSLEPRASELATGGEGPTTVEAMAATLDRAGLVEALGEAAAASAPVTVVVNDAHRFTDTRSFVEAMFTLLERRPVKAPLRLRLLVAAGSHRSEAAERAAHEREVLGPYRSRFTTVAWHDARGGGGLARVGGFELHRWMAGGGLFVACGSVEPHYFAGATGAHKTLSVGVMSIGDLAANHEGAMSAEAGGFRLEGNPVHEGVCRVLGDLQASGARLFAFDQIVVDGTVVACAAGPPLEALERLLPRAREIFGATLDDAVDLLVARVEPPLDRDLYQADKGIKNTEAAVRDGGVLVLEAECPGGIGLDAFVELLRSAPTHQAALDAVARRGYRLGDHKAVRLRRLTDVRRVSLAVVSAALPAALGQALGATIFADRISAAQWIRDKLGKPSGLRGLVVNDAGNLSLDLEAAS